MKWLVWSLVLLNLLVFGYFRIAEMAAVRPASEPLAAERLQLLTPEQLAARPAPAPSVPADTLACYEWSGFSDTYVPRARSVLEQLGLQFTLQPALARTASRYWVYVPPLGSLQQAQVRSNELRAQGLKDVFIVRDARWRNAISLGIFKDEATAARLAQELRSRGVRDAVSGARGEDGAQNSFVIKDMLTSRAAEFERLRPEFPDAELRLLPCE